MSDSTYDVTIKQVATNELSAAARLDRATEERIYRLFQTFFREAEEVRRWNVWNDIAWDDTAPAANPELIDAVLASYREDIFLPDYSARSLHLLRASRGRAWFLTRWSYEEGKHMLTLNEWLLRRGVMSDRDLRELTEAHLQTYLWEPLYTDGIAIFIDMMLWETREIARFESLKELANVSGDKALVAAMDFVLTDEFAHLKFFREALIISAEAYPENAADAMARVAEAQEFLGGTDALAKLLDIRIG